MRPSPLNLILTLRPPAKLYLGREGHQDRPIELDGMVATPGFPPFPAAPDLLVNTRAAELCGVTYVVAPQAVGDLRAVVSTLDPRCIRLVEVSAVARPLTYADVDQAVFCEIWWSSATPTERVVAQLGGDFWYYARDIEGTLWQRIAGYGLGDLDEVLAEYSLHLPAVMTVQESLHVQPVRDARH